MRFTSLPRSTARSAATRGLLIGAASLCVGAASSAQEYRIRNVGNWAVGAAEDGKGCFLTRDFRGPGDTTLLLGLDTDGGNRLSLLNANWSIKAKDRHSLTFRLSNVAFPKHLAVGIESDGKQGFVSSFGERFPAHFAASSFLQVFRGDVPVAKLGLGGSGAAVAELRRCVEFHRRKAAVTGGGKGDRAIPIDPFALDDERRVKK